MAASRDLHSNVTTFVKCPICLELFNSPKSLPCLHTFCLKCIEGHCRDNEPGDEAACPVCRQKFNIPESGVKGLVSNLFIADLVEARKTASDVAVQVPCEVCLLECDNNDHNVAACTMYCVDCCQKLCEPCSRPHRRWRGGPHKVVAIGSDVETELLQIQGGKCDKHKTDDVRLYCFDCKMNVCVICFAEEHQQHKCKNVNAVANENIKQIDADLVQVRKRAERTRISINRLDNETYKFMSHHQGVVDKLRRKGEELKQLIDAHVNELMLEVQSLKSQTCKEIESFKDRVEMKLLMFETFTAYCSELKLRGKPCDVTRAANGLRIRARKLLQNDVTLENYCAPVITFKPMNIHELLGAGQNFIGKVTMDSTVTSSCISFVTPREKTLEQQLAQSTAKTRYLRQQIEECHSEMADKDEHMNEILTGVKELKQFVAGMKAKKVDFEVLEAQFTEFRLLKMKFHAVQSRFSGRFPFSDDYHRFSES